MLPSGGGIARLRFFALTVLRAVVAVLSLVALTVTAQHLAAAGLAPELRTVCERAVDVRRTGHASLPGADPALALAVLLRLVLAYVVVAGLAPVDVLLARVRAVLVLEAFGDLAPQRLEVAGIVRTVLCLTLLG